MENQENPQATQSDQNSTPEQTPTVPQANINQNTTSPSSEPLIQPSEVTSQPTAPVSQTTQQPLQSPAPTTASSYPVEPSDPTQVTKKEVTTQKGIKKVRQIVFYILLVLEILLGLRLFFKLLTAQTTSTFVLGLFDLSKIFVAPFMGIVKDSGEGAHILEWSTLIAMIIYALLALIIARLARLFAPTDPQRVWEE